MLVHQSVPPVFVAHKSLPRRPPQRNRKHFSSGSGLDPAPPGKLDLLQMCGAAAHDTKVNNVNPGLINHGLWKLGGVLLQ